MTERLSIPGRLRRIVRSFRFRLTLYFVAILAAILAGFSIFIYFRQVQVLRVEATEQLSSLSDRWSSLLHAMLSQTSDNGTSENEPIPLNDMQLTLQNTEVMSAVGPNGSVLSQKGNLSSNDLSHIIQSWQNNPTKLVSMSLNVSGENSDTHRYLLKVTPLSQVARLYAENHWEGYLVVGMRFDPNGQLPRLAVTLGTATALILLLAFGGGYWLADRAMQPVQLITHTARQISESDLSRRLYLKRDDELGELAGTFDQMLDRVQAAFVRQRQFTADASHELRTPLSIIELEAERALERPRNLQEYERALQIIQSENEQMSSLVNELLLLARLDSNRSVLQIERLDLSEVAVDVVERLGAVAQAYHVSLSTGELGEAYVQAGRMYLARAISNLVENAIKFAQGEAAQVLVETGLLMHNGRDWGWVRVSDNGPGIPAEHLPHLFDRFYQIDPARSRDPQEAGRIDSGSGLGLAIVKSIVEAYGGVVEVSSQDGRGSVFTAFLPVANPSIN